MNCRITFLTWTRRHPRLFTPVFGVQLSVRNRSSPKMGVSMGNQTCFQQLTYSTTSVASRKLRATGNGTHLTHMHCRTPFPPWVLWTVIDLRLFIPVLYGKNEKKPTFGR
jgi:hypothetical protein